VSKKPEIKSSKASGPQAESYVYDFLYHDARRVASFLAQLGPYGQLTSLEHSRSTADSSTSTSKVTAQGGVPMVAAASGELNDAATTGVGEGLKPVYDPLWLNALDLYERLDASGLLQRDPTKAGMGQFVVVTGVLSVVDMALLKQMLESPLLRTSLIAQGTKGSGKNNAAQATAMKTGLELIRVMPHLIQARLTANGVVYWGSIAKDGLTTDTADLYLKHGLRISGSWTLMGILDALPDPPMDELQQRVSALTDAVELGAYAQGLGLMTPFVRPLLGRPEEAYGVTPLLIFREVSGR